MSLLKAMLIGGELRQDSFKVVTYVGTGTERAITGVGFQPDFVWVKRRDIADDHALCDSVRGATKLVFSNTTGIEVTDVQSVKSFDSDGFTLGTEGKVNSLGQTFVAWCWKADKAGVTDATQEESYNASAGLSIIKYVGDSTDNRILTHSLGRVPKLIIIKNLDSTVDWYTYTSELGIAEYLKLSTTEAASGDSGIRMAEDPTDSEITLGTSWFTNSANDYIAYVFSEIPDVSSFGSYLGTGAVGNVVNFGEDVLSATLFDDFSADTSGSYISTTGDVSYNNVDESLRLEYTQASNGGIYRSSVLAPGVYQEVTFKARSSISDIFNSIGDSSDLGVDPVNPALTTDWQDYHFKITPTGTTLRMYVWNGGIGDYLEIDDLKVEVVIPQGFQPAYVMIKRTDATGQWQVHDNKRDTHNPNTKPLHAESSGSEGSTTVGQIDLTSTGFVLQGTGGEVNVSGGEYIYMAFAELPQESSPENRDEPLFGQIAYTGDGVAGHSIDGLNFKPDLVWIKNRDAADSHQLFDIIRGVGLSLVSDTTAAELSDLDTLMAFGADGFTVGANVKVNTVAEEYMAWAWNAGGEAVPNEDGSIDSTVMANQEGGFSIVKWTGTGVNGTVGHGLDAAPDIISTKRLDVIEKWTCYIKELGATKYMRLNDTTAEETALTALWQLTEPTSSVFSIGTDTAVNNSTEEYIAYCWTSKSGVSDFGSYTGTGAAGKAVTLGFKPDMLVIKRTDVANNWGMYDSRRNTLNPVDTVLYSNVSNVEGTGHDIDFTDTGFELNDGDAAYNASGGNYIYMAFKVTEDPDTLHQVETGDLQLSDSLTDDNGTHTVSVSGDTQLSTAEVACGTHSILFDGSGDLLSAPDHDDWNFGTGDLTIDTWVNLTYTTNTYYIAGQYVDASNFWYFAYHGVTGLIFKKVSGGVTLECISTTVVPPYQLHHLAVSREAGVVRMYLDGQLLVLSTDTNPSASMPDLSSLLTIGYLSTTFFLGYMDHLRLTKGAALWTTTNFNLSDKGLYYPSGTLQI